MYLKKYRRMLLSFMLVLVLLLQTMAIGYAETEEGESSPATDITTEEKKETKPTDSSVSEEIGNESSGSSSESSSESSQSTAARPEDATAASTEVANAADATTEERKPVKKKTEKDDSNGRDYQKSEEIPSGNTSFTIVSISRDEEAINKKIKKQEEKKIELVKQLTKINQEIDFSNAEIDNVEAIYDMIRSATGIDRPDLYLSGCSKCGNNLLRPDAVSGLDKELRILAEMFDSKDLISWTKEYSTSLIPMEFTGEKKSEEGISNAAPILEGMKEEAAKVLTDKNTEKVPLVNSLTDVNEHIKLLEEQRLATMIQIDERLLEYKDKIPDQAVGFLNAAVSREGCPYVWGCDGPNAFDCSGLVSYSLRQAKAVGSGFRWTSIDFATNLRHISFSEALPGDLVWKPGHIAIYIDEDTVFEAPYMGSHVRFTSCNVQGRFSKVLRWWSEDND